MFEAIRSQGIRNVVIFVADSLRWDFASPRILQMGVIAKTIAGSLYTGSSFPSLVSGLYLPRHGVSTWEDRMPAGRRGLIELEGYNFSLWCETTWTDLPPSESSLHDVLGKPAGISLSEIQPPFIYIEDDKGGHCPYGLEFESFAQSGCPEFFEEYGRLGTEALRRRYREGIEFSDAHFFQRLETLKERGLLESTLVIYTSDHGELLGEYGGLIGHGRPPCPELVYVPTVFIHPSLSSDQMLTDGVIRHVDFLPTLAALFERTVLYKTDGINLFEESHLPKMGMNFRKEGYLRARQGMGRFFRYDASSVWDLDGGRTFLNVPLFKSIPYFTLKLISKTNPESWYLKGSWDHQGLLQKISTYTQAMQHLGASHLQYGSPKFSQKQARDMIGQYLQAVEPLEKQSQEIEDDVVVERLKNLGYID